MEQKTLHAEVMKHVWIMEAMMCDANLHVLVMEERQAQEKPVVIQNAMTMSAETHVLVMTILHAHTEQSISQVVLVVEEHLTLVLLVAVKLPAMVQVDVAVHILQLYAAQQAALQIIAQD